MIFDNTDFANKFWIVLTRFICKKISKKYSQGCLSYFMTVGLSPVFFTYGKLLVIVAQQNHQDVTTPKTSFNKVLQLIKTLSWYN